MSSRLAILMVLLAAVPAWAQFRSVKDGATNILEIGSSGQEFDIIRLYLSSTNAYELLGSGIWHFGDSAPLGGGGGVNGEANSNLSYVIGTDGTNNTTAATNSASVTNWIKAVADLQGATNGLNSRAASLESQTNSLGSRISTLDSGKQPTNNVLTQLAGVPQDFTNTVNAGVSNLVATNITVRAGASTSNAFVGGTIYFSKTSFTNLNALGTLSNLASVLIGAHTITNNGDMIRATWDGRTANALANTNQFQISFGGTTLLDTGLLPASNTVFRAWAEVTRTGTSAQHVEAGLDWGPSTGISFIRTNVNLETTINTGIAQTLALLGAARRVGAHTNNSFRVAFDPGPR